MRPRAAARPAEAAATTASAAAVQRLQQKIKRSFLTFFILLNYIWFSIVLLFYSFFILIFWITFNFVI